MIGTAANEPHRETSALPCAVVAILLLISACSSGQSGYSAAGSVYNSPATSAQPAPVATTATVAVPPQVATLSPPAASAPAGTQQHLTGVGSATVVTIHGKIVSVDRPNQLVTLEGPGGKKVTLKVENPYNLAAAKPGEPFVAKFYEIVTIRKKQPGESPPAASVAQGIVSATSGQTPGAAIASSVEVMVTIVAINQAKGTVDVQGPDGAVETVQVANPENLRRVKVGNDIVVRVTRVIAISLDKETSA